MLSYAVLVQCPKQESFQETLKAALQFLQSCTPKARQAIRFYLQDPPVAVMEVLDTTRQMGLAGHFRILHEQETAAWREAGKEIQIQVLTGKLSRDEILNQVCRPGRILIHYHSRPMAFAHKAPWYLQVREGQSEQRVVGLQQLLRQLFDDPSAISYMRRQAMEHFNRYCNQLTRLNLLQAMDALAIARGQIMR
jgi:hypothetical protein